MTLAAAHAPPGWLPGAQRLHASIATLLVALACLLAFAPPSLPIQAALFLAGVALVGMPHGSFDHIVARRRLHPVLGRLWWLAFLLTYLGLAGLVWLGWVEAPQTTLVLFLVASVVHFGLGDLDAADDRTPAQIMPAILARGALPILLPIAAHPASVAPVLAALAGGRADLAAAVVTWSDWLLLPWVLTLLYWITTASRADRLEILTLCAAFVLLPPILAFALYFCLCHSVRHLLRLADMMSPSCPRTAATRTLRIGLPAIALCILAAPLLFLHSVSNGLVPLFQLLAALTLPHMVVTLWLEDGANVVSS